LRGIGVKVLSSKTLKINFKVSAGKLEMAG